jgi:hypothetical protein
MGSFLSASIPYGAGPRLPFSPSAFLDFHQTTPISARKLHNENGNKDLMPEVPEIQSPT